MDERKEFPDRPWTLEEVAEYLSVAPRTVYDLMRERGLPSRKVGGAIRFVRAEIDTWISEQPPKANSADAA
jgi:excisionase family DNA binding protein